MINRDDRFLMERDLLNAILSDKEEFYNVVACGLKPELFESKETRIIAKGILDYYQNKCSAPDTASLYEYMFLGPKKIDDDDLKQFYTGKVINEEGLSPRSYPSRILKLFHEDTSERKFFKLIKEAEGSTTQGLDLLIEFNGRVSDLIYEHSTKHIGLRSNLDVAESVIKNIHDSAEGKYNAYIPTGFKYIDRKIIGFHKRGLHIIAARPSMGKTALMMQLKRNLCAAGYRVAIISIEMDAESLMIRDLADMTGIDSLKIESGNLSQDEKNLITHKITELANQPYIVDDKEYQTLETITTRGHHWSATGQADIILIDYLGKIKKTEKTGRDDKDLGIITGGLKAFAKTSGVPVVLFSQLNREVEKRPDKRPLLSDLRDSGDIEQDADTVLFIYRPDYYGLNPFLNQANIYKTCEGNLVDKKEYAEIIVSKARRARVGAVPVRYIKHLHRFESLGIRHAEDEATNKILSSYEDPFQ